MKRAIEADLLAWKNNPQHKPLLLRGARQVGKSYIVAKFGQKEFDNIVIANFEERPELADAFNKTLDPIAITDYLSRQLGEPIRPGRTLLFLDEVQDCPRAILALRYFKEKYQALHVIAAGSLLEFALKDAEFRMPVGRIESLYLKPLSFCEYLQARKKIDLLEIIKTTTVNNPMDELSHQLLLEELKIYFNIGGLPEIVQCYLDSKSLFDCNRLQATIYELYKRDFGKYQKRVKSEYVLQIYQQIPYIIAEKFKYAKITREVASRELKPALQALIDAGLMYQVFHTSASGIPFGATKNSNKFKTLFLDVGLVRHATHIGTQAATFGEWPMLNVGSLTEQFVGQEILAYAENYAETEIYYWEREVAGSSAEIDYLTNVAQKIFPIEVKSGSTGRLKSLQGFVQEKNCDLGVRISERPLQFERNVLSIPLYMVAEMRRLIENVLLV